MNTKHAPTRSRKQRTMPLNCRRILGGSIASLLSLLAVPQTVLADDPATFWLGGTDGTWTGFNWASDAAGTTTTQIPTAADDITFSVTLGAANQGNTTLEQDFIIQSLTINDTAAVGIFSGLGGPFTLTISGSAGTGIDVQAAAGLLTIGANLTLAGSSDTITVNNVAGAVIDGVVGGGNALIKEGSGTLTLTAANSYTGVTTVNAGTLQIGDGVTLGTSIADSGQVQLLGGALAINLSDGETFTNDVNNASAINAIAAGTNTLSGVISGGGTFNQNGTGTTILTGANSYTGVTTVNAGTLQIGDGVTLGTSIADSGQVQLLGGALAINLSDGETFTNDVNNASAINAIAAGTNTISGVISGGGTFNQNGTGTTILTGANSYAGDTLLNSGTLIVNNNTALGTGTLIIADGTTLGTMVTGTALTNPVMVNGNFTVTSTGAVPQDFSLNGAIDLGNAVRTITGASNGSQIHFGGGIADGTGVGAGGIVFNTTGVPAGGYVAFIMDGVANTYTGLTTVDSEAILVFQTTGTEKIAGNVLIQGTGVVDYLGVSDQIADTATVTVNSTGSNIGTAFQGLELRNYNETIATLNGSAAGTVGLGSGTLTVSDGTFAGTILDGAFGTGGKLVKNGAGTLTLTGANSYTGTTTVNDGTLQIGDGVTPGTSIASSGQVQLLGGALDINLSHGSTFTNDVNNATMVNAIAAGTNTLSGAISGGGSFNQNGGGTTILTGASSYTGVTTVNAGTLQIGDGVTPGTSIASSGQVQVLGGALDINLSNGSVFTNAVNNATVVNAIAPGTNTLSGVISGGGSFNQNGGGTTILTGASSYTGVTTVNAGKLQIGDGATVGTSIASSGEVQVLGGLLDINLSNGSVFSNAVNNATVVNAIAAGTNTLSGVIRGTGAFTQTGAGTTILTGMNSYTGGTFIASGTLAAGSAKAFGSGNLTVIGGTLRAAGAPVAVDLGAGNIQITGGSFIAQVGGTSAGVLHDQLKTTGSAVFAGGTLGLVQQNGYLLAPGDKVILLSAAAGVAGGSANGTAAPSGSVTGLAAFSNSPLLVPTVNLYTGSVVLEAMQGSFSALTSQLNLTPNQRAVAGALDSLTSVTGGKTGIIKELNFLDTQPIGTLAGNLDKIAPEELTSIFRSGVSLANIQTANLQRRLEDIRGQAGSSSASGLSAAGSGPSYSGGMNGPSGKGSKEIAPPNEDRWGAFLTGSGEFTRVGSTTNAAGYRLETSGVTGGVDYRVNDYFVVGLSFGYVGTASSLANGGSMDTDGGRLGLYASYFEEKIHFDFAVTGGLNSYKTRRTTPNNTSATGSPDGSEINILIAAGYDLKYGALTVAPTVSYQYTSMQMDGFTETGAFAPLSIRGQSAESSRTALGVRAYYDAHVGGVTVRPEARIAWQHEFADTAYSITSSFANLGGSPFTVTGAKVGRDSLLVGAGFSILWSDRFATYLYYDGEVGRSNYDSHSISGGVRMQF
jgi:autotransporter-associated beta strand protein